MQHTVQEGSAHDWYARGVVDRPKFWRNNGLLLDAVPDFYTPSEFEQISALCQNAVRYERKLSGDTNDVHDLDLTRLIGAPAGQAPTLLQAPAQQFVDLVGSPRLLRYLQGILGIGEETLHFRRMQSHVLKEGQFIGPHMDIHGDPDFEIVFLIYPYAEFEGGEHVIDPLDGRPLQELAVRPGQILVTPVDVWHWVKPVTKGLRRSMFGFMSRYNGINRRDDLNPPRYADVRAQFTSEHATSRHATSGHATA